MSELTRRGFVGSAAALVVAPAFAQRGGPDLVKIVGDRSHLALFRDGSVIGWGYHDGRFTGKLRAQSDNYGDFRPVRIRLPRPAIDIANDSALSFAILDDGSLWAWGWGVELAFGNWTRPATVAEALRPRKPGVPAAPIAASAKKRGLSLGAIAGRVLGQGSIAADAFGVAEEAVSGRTAAATPGAQNGPTASDLAMPVSIPSLGYGDSGPFPKNWETATPRRIQGLPPMKRIALGDVAVALSQDGRVFVWGRCDSGIVPAGVREPNGNWNTVLCPLEMPGIRGIIDISARNGCALALTGDGRVLSWGSNVHGGLGRPTAPEYAERIEQPDFVAGLGDVVSIATGANACAALRADGTVWVWGSNGDGLFGDIDPRNVTQMKRDKSPVARPVPNIANAVELTMAQGGRHALVRLKDGTLRGWGNTDWGQIGAGLKGTYQPGAVVPHIKSVAHVWASGNNSFAVKQDGSLWAWGAGGKTEWPLGANLPEPQPFSFPVV